MPNPRYAEKDLRHPNDNIGEGSSSHGKKSPNRVGKIGKEAHKIYQQPNRFGMDKKKKKMKTLSFPENPHKSSHVVPVRYG